MYVFYAYSCAESVQAGFTTPTSHGNAIEYVPLEAVSLRTLPPPPVYHTHLVTRTITPKVQIQTQICTHEYLVRFMYPMPNIGVLK